MSVTKLASILREHAEGRPKLLRAVHALEIVGWIHLAPCGVIIPCSRVREHPSTETFVSGVLTAASHMRVPLRCRLLPEKAPRGVEGLIAVLASGCHALTIGDGREMTLPVCI